MTKVTRQNPEFGDWLKEKRIQAGFRTQRDLAKNAKVKTQTVTDAESKGIVPNESSLKRICAALNCRIEDIQHLLEKTTIRSFTQAELGLGELYKEVGKRDGANKLFLVTDDSLPVGEEGLAEVYRIVKDHNAEVCVLFATTREMTFLSFHTVHRLLKHKYQEIDKWNSAFTGYHLKQELKDAPLIVHPYLFLWGMQEGPRLYFHYPLESRFQELREDGISEAKARFQSLLLFPCTEQRARFFHIWVDLKNDEPSEEKWQRIIPESP